MRILLINYRFFISGGPERYLFNLKDLLERKKHTIIEFSVKYTQNEKSKYEKYFVSPLSAENEIYFKDQTWNFKSLLKTLSRSFYSYEVYRKLDKLIRETKPDYAIILHYKKKLSPSILTALNDNEIPFVVRISDFEMICPNGLLMRNGQICELCIHGKIINSIRYKCVQNSYSASIINYLSTKFHKHQQYFDLIKFFIVPSKFTMNKMISAGISVEKLIHIPTFVDRPIDHVVKKKNIILYFGRIEKIKGIHILLEAVKYLQSTINYRFQIFIVGKGSKEYLNELMAYIFENKLRNIRFTGFVNKTKLDKIIKNSVFSIIPALWYDNMPNSVLESLAQGTPVIASNHGSFPDIVKHGDTGLLFEPGDSKDLAIKMKSLLIDQDLNSRMGQNAIDFISTYHSSENHYNKIMNVYKTLISNNS